MLLGVDMGGTNTRIGLVNDKYELEFPCRVIPSARFAWAEEPVDALALELQDYIVSCGNPYVEAAAVSAPASVSKDFCTVFCAPNLKNRAGERILDGVPLGKMLSKRLRLPVLVNKDVNYLLLCDIRQFGLSGVAAGCWIGTGLGSAVSIDGRLLYGKNGYAMDCGHLPLFHEQGLCGCGKHGCVETKASGVVLKALRERCYPDTPMDELFLRHANDEPVQEFLRDCAWTPAALISTFDPDTFILGGGIAEAAGFPRETFLGYVWEMTNRAIAADPPRIIWEEKLPERGVIGAACFARSLAADGKLL